jgi:glycosyltransferase involved in cell wall biosynthesis
LINFPAITGKDIDQRLKEIMLQEENLQPEVGVVAIARNEGERLRQCLESVLNCTSAVVYVDSGSTDGSVNLARSRQVEVVELNLSIPFTAARARNAGFTRLLQRHPDLKFVQFVDGDCEIVPGWIETARQGLHQHSQTAVICGRRRERFPQQSIYNRLCDLEWDTPVGEAKACGGDAMMRVTAFERVGGYNPTLIAGEEPELCVRLRQQGWKIFRLPAEMTCHDAQMFHFSQWWKRSVRAGHAYAQGAWLHGNSPQRHWVKESRSIWFWGLGLPLLALGLGVFTQGMSLFLWVSYPILLFRIYYSQKQQYSRSDAFLYAIFCVLGKFPQVQGQVQFYFNRLSGRSSKLIEYKTVSLKSPSVENNIEKCQPLP